VREYTTGQLIELIADDVVDQTRTRRVLIDDAEGVIRW
jgi:hypothetical protein